MFLRQLLSGIFLLGMVALSGQQAFVHFDKPLYANGEDVWYQTYLLNGDTESRVLHVEWWNPEGEMVLEQLLKIENGMASGDLRIPEKWTAGTYTFRAYTLWMLNYGAESVFTKKIPIVGVLNQSGLAYQVNQVTEQQTGENLSIQLKTNQEQYMPGEEVALEVIVKDANGAPVSAHLSVSVYDEQLLPTPIDQITNYTNKNVPTPAQISYAAETKIRMHGQLLEDDGTLKVKNGLLAFHIIEDQKDALSTINAGNFSVEFPDFYGSRKVQVMDIQAKPPHLFATTKITPWQEAKIATSKADAIDPKIVANYQADYQQRRQFQSIFKLPQIAPVVDTSSIKSPNSPNNSYVVDEFIAFPTFEEFIREVILPVRIKHKKKGAKMKILSDINKTFFTGPPMFLLDNQITYDLDPILALSLDEVYKVEVFRTAKELKKAFGILGRHGVFAVYTKEGKLDSSLLSIKGFAPNRTFQAPDTKKPNNPDFRPLLYWNPSLKTDAQGRAKIVFKVSDDRSVFRINVQGVGAQQTGAGNLSIKVK